MYRRYEPSSMPHRMLLAIAAVLISLTTLTLIDSLAQRYGDAWHAVRQGATAIAKR